MKRVLINYGRAFVILALAGLIGYYNFEAHGWIVLITNVLMFVAGILLVTTWARKKSESNSETQSSNEPITDVNVAEPSVEIGMEGPLSGVKVKP